MALYTKSCLSYPATTTHHKDFANRRLLAQSLCASVGNTHGATAIEPCLAHDAVQSQEHCSTNIHPIPTNKPIVSIVIDAQATLSPIENAKEQLPCQPPRLVQPGMNVNATR